MADGLLSLSWNNHKATFCHILSTLREKERYTDVTLACEGKFYPVHKLVLSTCSEYFESMFEQTPCKHPIIVLKDLKSDEIESLLSYMYAGVVNVAQSDLARLIKAAEMLKVKGLAVPDEPPQEVMTKKSHPPPWSSRDDRSSPHPKRKRREESEAPVGEPHMSSSPPSSPRASPYHPASDFHQENTRISNEAKVSESRADKTIDRLEEESKADQKSESRLDQQSANQTSPLQVVLDDTLVKEEILDPIEDDQDTLMNSGMDYNSLTSDTRLENSASEGGGQDHNQLLPNKFEQSIVSAQPQHLQDAVVEALAGPSGMQGWLGSGDLGGGFSGVESYSGDGRHQDLRQSVPGQQPQPHQMVKLMTEAQWTGMSVRATEGRSQSHAASTRSLPCPFCSYTTFQSSHLKYHILTHTGEKPFACPHCPFRCNRKSSLKIHLRKHTGEKPYTCPRCPYQSTVSSHLKRHMRTHLEGEKQFMCTHCPHLASSKGDLLDHLRIHFSFQ